MTSRRDGIPHPRDPEDRDHNPAPDPRTQRPTHTSPYARFLDEHTPGDPLHTLARALFDTATELDTLDAECAHRCPSTPSCTTRPAPGPGSGSSSGRGWVGPTCGQEHLPCARIAGMYAVAHTALARLLRVYEAATETQPIGTCDGGLANGAPDGELAPLPDHSLVNDAEWQAHWKRFTHLTTPLRARGLMCDVDFGLHSHTVYAFLSDGTYLTISHDLHAEGPETANGWLVTREREDPNHVEVLYDSIPEQNGIQSGRDARHGSDLTALFSALDAYLDGTNRG